MRMHTIPQNVTAYEDKIVGMLVGRQFIYLAIAGVIIFVLLSTNVGPFLVRAFISLLIGGFATALALFKPNDRNFDALMMSYVASIFGPTEWVWRKDQVSIEKLRLLTDQLAGKPPAMTTSSSPLKPGQDNLLRVSRYQTFISSKESGMDNEELDFVEQLNFNEPIPQKAFAKVESNQPAPPMLTKQNYAQVKALAKPTPAPTTTPIANRPKPVSPLAGNSVRLGATIAVAGRQQGVQLRSNLRTNRSLSKQLLTSGVINLPVRGERQLDLSPDLKDELKELTSATQRPTPKPSTPTKLLSGEPKPAPAPAQTKPAPQPPMQTHIQVQVQAPAQPQPQPATVQASPTPIQVQAQAAAPAAQPQPQPQIQLQPQPAPTAAVISNSSPIEAEPFRRTADYSNSKMPTISAQISMLGQAMPNSGITKGATMSDLPNTQSPADNTQSGATQPSSINNMPNTPTPESTPTSGPNLNPSTPPSTEGQPDPVKVIPSTPPQAPVAPVDLEQEANKLEAQAQQALNELSQPAPPTPVAPLTSATAPTITPSPVAAPASLQPQTQSHLVTPSPTESELVLSTEYEAEINRLKTYSQEMEQKAKQAEIALQQLQQQLAGQEHPTIGSQLELVEKLRQQQAQTDAYRQELEQKITSSKSDHIHAEYAPVPQVAPVIAEPTPVASTPPEPAPGTPQPPTPPAAPPAPPTTITPQTAPAQVATTTDSAGPDLQARMAAAGVGPADTATPATSAATVISPSDMASPAQKTVALTSQPNIINGAVVDAQGQQVPGVIVVVKNAQGESKRALKTNKLGQFVVTTPLTNGTYSVEVDKKGLSFDIMQVELNGSILQPIIIKSKPA